MARADGPVRVVGRLGLAQPFIGFAETDDGYAVVFGTPEGGWRRDPAADPDARRTGLVCLAMAFFLENATGPPPELEATQADVARLVQSLVSEGAGPAEAAAIREALDAIDDGLAADAVALRLQRLLGPGVDPLTALRQRAEALTR